MSSIPSSSTTVSASAYLHLAPHTPNPFTTAQLRSLVFDYLQSQAYPDSAKAFAREVHTRDTQLPNTTTLSSPRIVRRSHPTHSHSPSRNPSTNGNGNGSRAYPMLGVEATPPPFDLSNGNSTSEEAPRVEPDGDTAMHDDLNNDDPEEGESEQEETGHVSNGRTNGKAVAFEDVVEENGERTNGHGDEDVDDDRDWPLLSKAELQQIRLRRDIRAHILTGRIHSAVDLLTTHFPAVLSPPPPPQIPAPPPPSLSPRKAAAAALAAASSPHTFFVPTPSSSASYPYPNPTSNSKTPSVPILGATFSPSALSLSPQILSLNLQLQSFVELIRSASTSSLPTSRTTTPGDQTPPSMSGSTSSILSTGGRSTGSGRGSGGGMNKAIKQSQRLRAKVGEMEPGKEREAWEAECVDVSGLMAYTDLEICPVRGYLSQGRREVLAELVNAAILKHTKHTPMPLLALVARQTTTIWQALAEWKLQFPPVDPGQPKDRRAPKTYPRFDLHKFLEETEVEGGKAS
ncbi:hypothetical protein P7C70_g4969, partial [Phenoliferia sp. Uapishka_3]